jgi:prepilin-type processing-associated H-X9-DG protein
MMIFEKIQSVSYQTSMGIPYYELTTPAAMRAHLEGANYAFGDGHVKWYSWQKMIALSGGDLTKLASTCGGVNKIPENPTCSKFWNGFTQ